MIKKKITLQTDHYEEVINIIKDFIYRRDLIFEERKNNKTIYTIYDRKTESGALVGMLDMFTSRYLLPKRLRVIVEIYEEYNRLNIDMNGDVMMLDWNLVEHTPRRRDQIRLENFIEDLAYKIHNVKKTDLD